MPQKNLTKTIEIQNHFILQREYCLKYQIINITINPDTLVLFISCFKKNNM